MYNIIQYNLHRFNVTRLQKSLHEIIILRAKSNKSNLFEEERKKKKNDDFRTKYIRRTMLVGERTRVDRQNDRKGATTRNKKRDVRRSIRDEYSDTSKNTIARKTC